MRKKITVNTLAVGNLKTRKKQYALLLMGIVLSMIFSSGVLFFISCLRSSAEENRRNTVGNADAIVLNCGDIDFGEPSMSDMVGRLGYAHIFGYGTTERSDLAGGVAIGYLDDKALDLSYASLLSGDMPASADEIAVEKSVLLRMFEGSVDVGDKITFEVQGFDGEKYSSETVKRTFTLSGILRDKRQNMLARYSDRDPIQFYLPAALTTENSELAALGQGVVTAYISFTERTDDIFLRFHSLAAEKIGSERVVDTFESSLYFTEGLSAVSLPILLAVVMLLISALGIVNAFNTNLRSRKTQIGLLRAVGATKIQIISIFGREALILAGISAPLSVAAAYGLVKLVIYLLGDNFIFIPDIKLLLISAVVGVAAVMLAALIPLSAAARVSPVQAIRGTDNNRIAYKKKIHSVSEFSVPKLCAKRYMLFNRKMTALTAVILSAAIILSCFGFSIYKCYRDDVYEVDYDYQMSVNSEAFGFLNASASFNGYTENDIAAVRSLEHVEAVHAGKNMRINILKDSLDDYSLIACLNMFSSMFEYTEDYNRDNFLEKATAKFSSEYLEFREKVGYEEQYIMESRLSAVDSEALEQLRGKEVEGKINIDKLNSGEEVIVICSKKLGIDVEYDGNNDQFFYMTSGSPDNEKDRDWLLLAENSYHAGDELRLSCLKSDEATEDNTLGGNFSRTDKTVKIGAVVYDSDATKLGISTPYYISACTTLAAADIFYPNCKYNQMNIKLNTECTDEIESEIAGFLKIIDMNTQDSRFFSKYEYTKNNKEEIGNFFASVVSIAILFFAVCGSMVNNSVTAKIRESKRTVGTLRAVGASARELFSSYVIRILSVLGIGAVGGFGGFTLIYLIIEAAGKIFDREIFLKYSILESALFFVVLTAICALNVRLKIKKEMKHSIVDNIREL